MKNKFLIFVMVLSSLTLHAQQDTVVLNVSQCRDMALERNRNIQHGDNAIRQAELSSKAAFTNFFPQLEGSAIGAYIQDQNLVNMPNMMEMDLLLRGMYLCGFQLTQPLYAGGKIVNGYKLSKLGVEVAEEQQRQIRAQSIADVETAYWSYVAVLSKVDMLNEYKSQLDTLNMLVETNIAVGMAIDYDLLQLQTEQSNINYQMKRVLNGAQMCRMSLSRMVGIDPDSIVIVPAVMPDDVFYPIAETSFDISNRPEMSLLEYQLKASELQVKMKRGEYLPTLGAALGYNWLGNIQMKGSFNISQLGSIPLDPPMAGEIDNKIDKKIPMVMVSLSVPISKWWEGSYNIKKAKLEVDNSRLMLDENAELMQLEVRNAINNVNDGCELVMSSKIAHDAATEQLRVVRNRYSVSMAPISDLLDAQSKWQQAESNYIEAQTQYLIYKIEYLRVTGQLD